MISKGELARFKYDLRKDKIGEGAFGKVYKAYDTFLDRTVALKIGERREMNGKFFSLSQEIEAVQHLPVHPNIAYYDQVFEEESIHGIFEVAVMQYYDEGNLRDYIVNQFIKLTPDIKKSLILGILEGIKHLHKHKVIHRDLKTSNILLVKRQDGLIIPKITDFGLSKAIDSSENSFFTNSFIGGTIDYSPPEQLGGGIVGYSADIWSFGAIIYEIITGLKLFKQSGSSSNNLGQVEIMNNILKANLPDNITILPPNIQQIIKSCIVVDSNNRISLNEIQSLITFENIKVDFTPVINFNDLDEYTIILKENGIDQDLLFKMKDPDYYSFWLKVEARRKAEEEARIKAEEEARRKIEEEARIKVEGEVRRRIEEEARRKAEEEARIKAEEEARIKAEEEDRKKAKEEAKSKAEGEARKKAEEEDKIKAEEEVRKKSEEDARLKAQEEAHRDAEEEAKRKEAELKARRKVEEESLIKRKKEEELVKKLAAEEARKKEKEQEHRLKVEEKQRNDQSEAERKRKIKEEGKGEKKLLVFWINNKMSIAASAVILFGVLVYVMMPKEKIYLPPREVNSDFVTDIAAWNIATIIGKTEDFENYLKEFPEGSFKDEAHNKIDAISSQEFSKKEDELWKNNLKINDKASYENYLSKYPEGKYREIAKSELERIKKEGKVESEIQALNLALEMNTIGAYKSFLDRYPESKEKTKIQIKIQNLEVLKEEKEDLEAFKNAIAVKTIASLNTYLEFYPTGKYIAQVNEEIRELKLSIEQESIKNKFEKAGNNLDQLKSLANQYPNFKNISVINSRIKNLEEKRKPDELPPSPLPEVVPEKPLPPIITHIEDALVPISGSKRNNFKMLETEVTQNMWMTVMGGNPSRFKDCEKCPVENVSYHEVIAFIQKLNDMQSKFKYSLPSEEQWEYAAFNKGRYNEYAGSADISEVAVYKLNSKNGTSPVKSKKPNGLGLYDMSGNVYEWTNTNFSSKEMVIKGGSWKDPASSSEIRSRGATTKDDKSSSIGFRIIRQ